jgi:ribosome-associated protein
VLLGADAFRGLPSWHRWHELFNLAHFVVVERPGVNLEAGLPEPLLAIWRDKRVEDPGILNSRRAGAIFVQPIVPVDISATLIRDRVAREGNAGTKWRGLLPPAVLAYIERHHLYLRGRMRLNKLQQTAVTALEDIKARDITVLDVRKITSIYDSMIIATAESNRQAKALAHHVRDRLKEAGATIQGVEGEATGEWVLVDCGDIVVHVMQPAVRAYYNLEELWQDAASTRRAKAAA